MISLSDLYKVYTASGRVKTDSRKVTAGDVFIALRGDNFDGNLFAAAALEMGASAVAVDNREVYDSLGPEEKKKTFLSGDSLHTLQELARMHRKKLGIPVLAITGSNGKTTTKELILRVLSRKFRTSANESNLNNHIGVPLTLLSIPAGTEFAIVEMGANHRGEIKLLCEIAAPDYGIITNIGFAHLEGFGGPEGVRRGKGELLDYLLQTHGTAFYLVDSPVLVEMVGEREGLSAVPYSAACYIHTDKNGLLSIKTDKGDTVNTNLSGDYNVYNVAAAITVGRYFCVPEADIISALESYVPDNNRSQRVLTGKNTVILDAYNANPSSMRAALENFASENTPLHKTAILGDMRELGEYSPKEHAAIVSMLEEMSLDKVLLVGPEFRAAAATAAVAGGAFRCFADTAELNEYMAEHPVERSLVLIKGSRGIGLEKVLPSL